MPRQSIDRSGGGEFTVGRAGETAVTVACPSNPAVSHRSSRGAETILRSVCTETARALQVRKATKMGRKRAREGAAAEAGGTRGSSRECHHCEFTVVAISASSAESLPSSFVRWHQRAVILRTRCGMACASHGLCDVARLRHVAPWPAALSSRQRDSSNPFGSMRSSQPLHPRDQSATARTRRDSRTAVRCGT